ncbi:MAG: hypothetical protein GY849_02675 [Deltaproteobacteria bacterium]|nr:hypothetical protein [Deltaproteobacteria bacterium]
MKNESGGLNLLLTKEAHENITEIQNYIFEEKGITLNQSTVINLFFSKNNFKGKLINFDEDKKYKNLTLKISELARSKILNSDIDKHQFINSWLIKNHDENKRIIISKFAKISK